MLFGLSSVVDGSKTISEDMITENKEELDKIINICTKDMQITNWTKYNDKRRTTDKVKKEDSSVVQVIKNLNKILERWSSSEIETVGIKRVRKNGKQIRVRTYQMKTNLLTGYPNIDQLIRKSIEPKIKKNHFSGKLLD